MSLRKPPPSRARVACLALPMVIALAAAPVGQDRSTNRTPRRLPGVAFEASGVVGVPGASAAVFVDDSRPGHVFLLALSDTGIASVPEPIALGASVNDLEDITTDGTWYYAVGSQSKGAGRRAPGLVRFRLDVAARRVTTIESVADLERLMVAAVPELAGLVRRNRDGVNIEGLAWDAARDRLLFGLRSPMIGGDAVIVVARIGDRGARLSARSLAFEPELVRLNLGGLAVRGLGSDSSTGHVLVIGGAATDDPRTAFRLFDWDGVGPVAPAAGRAIASAEKPEGVTRVLTGGRMRTLLVFDLSAYQLLD